MITRKILFNRRNNLDKHGKGIIELRVIVNRTTYYFATGVKLFPIHWDAKTSRANTKCPDWYEINEVIADFIKRIDSYAIQKVKDDQDPDIEEIKSLFGKKEIDQRSFIEFTRAEINSRQDLKFKTQSGHLSQLTFIESFSPSGLKFKNMNFTWVDDFDRYMITKGMSKNTRWKYHKFIKTYLNVAMKKGITNLYPYDQFKVAREDGNREALTLAELKELEDLDRSNLSATQIVCLDKFLFSCYTGLRISDIEILQNKSFEADGAGIYLSIKQQKSERMVRNLPLHKLFNGKAVIIYERYFNRDQELLFPILSSKEVNLQLKNIATFTNIKKVLTFHMARHTFGSALAEIFGDVLLIKELMGHSKIETSMIYIHMSKQRIESKLDRFNFDY